MTPIDAKLREILASHVEARNGRQASVLRDGWNVMISSDEAISAMRDVYEDCDATTKQVIRGFREPVSYEFSKDVENMREILDVDLDRASKPNDRLS